MHIETISSQSNFADEGQWTHSSVDQSYGSDLANPALSSALLKQADSFPRRSYLPVYDNQLWMIKSGFVRTLSLQEDGSYTTLGVWGSRDVVGQPLSQANPYVVETMTPVEAIAISTTDWFPSSTMLLGYLHQLEALMLIRSRRPVDVALLGVLGWLGERFSQPTEHGRLLSFHVTHQDLADLSGTTRVTVTRLLRQFELHQLIQRKSRQLILSGTHEHWYYMI
jgi:CRP-like cAMP-binding protein